MAWILFALIAVLGEPSSNFDSDAAPSKGNFDARTAYATAAGMLASSNYEQAEARLTELLKLAPDFPFAANAALRLAECQLALQQPGDAAATLILCYASYGESEQALALEPDLPIKLDSVALRTVDMLAKSKVDQPQLVALAEAVLARAESDSETRPQMLLKVSQHFESRNDYEAAAKWTRLALESLPNPTEPQPEQADLLASLQERLEFTLPMNHARFAASQKEFETAISELKKLNEQAASLSLNESQYAAVRFQLAEILQQAGQSEKALQQWNELSLHASSMIVKPDWYATTMIRQAELLIRTNRYSEANAILAKLSNDVNETAAGELRFLQARCAIHAIEFARAEELLQTNLAKHASGTLVAAKSQWLLGELYLLQRDYAKAIACYDAASKAVDFPQWASLAQFQAAQCCDAMGDKTQAQAKYAVVISKFPAQSIAGKAKERMIDLSSAERPDRTADSSSTHPIHNASAR